MAVVKAAMKAAIISRAKAVSNVTPEGDPFLDDLAEWLSTFIVSDLIPAMVVSTTVAVPADGLLAPNGAVTGQATGTGTGTVS